jgi:hypothetical protein
MAVEMNIRLASRWSLLLLAALLSFSQVALVSAQRSRRKAVVSTDRRSIPYISFSSGQSSLNVPFDLVGNLILVRTQVNKTAPLWFIFDTGATHTVVDTGQAKELGLKAQGRITATGSTGTDVASRVSGVSIGFPGVELFKQTIYTLPIDFLSPLFGRRISGIIGNDIIGKFTVEIDYANKKLNFHAPSSYRYDGSGQIIPLTIEGDGNVFTNAEVEIFGHVPLKGKFEVDTGSTGSVEFNAPYVRKYRLLDYFIRPKQVNLGGVGGKAGAFVARVRSVTLGRFTIYMPVVKFSQATEGDSASAGYDGQLGGQIFSRFKMIVDLSRRRMILEPNARIDAPFEEDMSGLEVVGAGDNFSTYVINDVEKESPGAEAGIEEDDVLTAIDGRAAGEFTLDEIRRMFMQNEREYLLTLKRGSETMQVNLKIKARSVLDLKP